jgi:hypothetical protein
MDMDIQTQAPDDYSSALYLRCPPSLPQAIRKAARGNLTSTSSYIRRAILSQLKRDG